MSEITEEKKLIWLGLKNAQQDLSEIKAEIDTLQSNFDDLEDFTNGLANQGVSTYSELQTYLENNGFTTDKAETFITKIQNNFADYSSFETFLETEIDSLEELKNEFSDNLSFESQQETTEGDSVAGMRIHEDGGVTHDDISVPEGTLELYGNEIHFSQQGGQPASPSDITVSNLTTSDSSVDTNENVTISVDVTNNGGQEGSEFISLVENGSVTESEIAVIDAGQTKTLEFIRFYSSPQNIDYTVRDLGPVTVSILAGGDF